MDLIKIRFQNKFGSEFKWIHFDWVQEINTGRLIYSWEGNEWINLHL